jgi:hypothetical protein
MYAIYAIILSLFPTCCMHIIIYIDWIYLSIHYTELLSAAFFRFRKKNNPISLASEGVCCGLWMDGSNYHGNRIQDEDSLYIHDMMMMRVSFSYE